MELISRKGPIVEIVPRILSSGSVMWYKVEFPGKLSFKDVPGSSMSHIVGRIVNLSHIVGRIVNLSHIVVFVFVKMVNV
ncbi:hypothetical protein CEXT_713051 [Caerostris extrusa]|uniref:Uncharacterized protein n=1 Tax=Caerostris extrusa TaxID=172846 RepID=A0AAV4RGD9_CAEEX|nr:hypothetical protein CEXT_713051 [Caerostris extrusa]